MFKDNPIMRLLYLIDVLEHRPQTPIVEARIKELERMLRHEKILDNLHGFVIGDKIVQVKSKKGKVSKK